LLHIAVAWLPKEIQGDNMFVPTRRRLLSLASVPAAIALSPTAFTSPRPITNANFVPIGGIRKWVEIRGRDRSRPAVLFLHGGPCDAQSPHLSLFAPWEERYVVTQWDQRGAGKTLPLAEVDRTFSRVGHRLYHHEERFAQRFSAFRNCCQPS